jgi:DNA-binding LacI/PurR family transcriptional regulator
VPSVDDRLYNDLHRGALQGLAIWSPINFPRGAFEVARRRRVPVLSFKNSRHLPIDLLSYGDIENLITDAAQSFIAAGRTRIAVIHSVGDMELPDRKSLAQLIKDLGGQCKSEHVVMRQCTRDGGYSAAASLPMQQLDALIVTDDYMASGVERYLHEHNIRVPEALQIASLINPVSGITFSLPMIRYQFDFKRVNVEGIELLTQAIDGKVAGRQQRLTPLERID